MRFHNSIQVTLASFSVVFVAMGTPLNAQSYQRRQGLSPYVELGGPERRGCYWIMQHEYCGRYCYTEVDGKRYCRERERLAYPQGPFYNVEPGHGSPMKLGGMRR